MYKGYREGKTKKNIHKNKSALKMHKIYACLHTFIKTILILDAVLITVWNNDDNK